MALNNLPSVPVEKLDGNTLDTPTNDNPLVLVLGTAPKGTSDFVFNVNRVSDTISSFGKTGTLTRGILEASGGGALNLNGLRIGGSAAILDNVGAGKYITVAAQTTGSGLDDMTSNSGAATYTGEATKVFVVKISLAAATDEFDWSSDGGATFPTTGVAMTGAAQALSDGVTVTFVATTGHTLNDEWTFSGVSAAGYTLTTVDKDDSAGTDFTLFYDDAVGVDGGRLRVYRDLDSLLVYDNNPAAPTTAIDLGYLAVEGSSGGNGALGVYDGTQTIGVLATPVTLLAADAVGGAAFTAGTDGITPSKMELYEELYKAYDLLRDQEIDELVPMGVHLDDLNVMDMTQANVTTRGLDTISAYPTEGVISDALGKVFIQEFEGEFHFWWWFPESPNAAVGAEFTANGGANIFPAATVGSSTATTDTLGVALTGADFHEVNFAYQLANFCYRQSLDIGELTGSIGMNLPTDLSMKGISSWVGTAPTTTTGADGVVTIAVETDNGTGLLGNKFKVGRKGSALTTGIPGFTVDSVDGLYQGGFIATDNGFLDGVQLKDANDHLIDIGQYISIVASTPILSNSSSTQAYMTSGAAAYTGFYSNLPANEAPSNKVIPSIRLGYKVGLSKIDNLGLHGYVTFHQKKKGLVVSDAPTGARPDSDYRRLSTVRQVKSAVDAVRARGEVYLGKGMTGNMMQALNTAIEKELKVKVKNGVLRRAAHFLSSTQQQTVLGQASLLLTLVPAFEFKKLTVTVALAAS